MEAEVGGCGFFLGGRGRIHDAKKCAGGLRMGWRRKRGNCGSGQSMGWTDCLEAEKANASYAKYCQKVCRPAF